MYQKRYTWIAIGLSLAGVLSAGTPSVDTPQRAEGYQAAAPQATQGAHPKHRADAGKKRHRKMPRWLREKSVGHLEQTLALTPQQRNELRALVRTERQAIRLQRRERRQQRNQSIGLLGHLDPDTFMSVDHFDADAFVAAMERQQALRKANRRARRHNRLNRRAAFVEKVFAILTPEQRLKWIELSR
jgi:Spy/CpxP family protein refolding chaperone